MNKNNVDYFQIFLDEGFTHVYKWMDDKASIVYPKHVHKGKVSLFIEKGSVTFCFDNEEKIIFEGERFDVPVGVEHTALVGDMGCSYVVGEMIQGDS